MTKKKYNSHQVEAVYNLKTGSNFSIRKIAEFMDIPKSVVGRWVKDPKMWKEKYRFNIPEHIKISEKKFKALQKFKRKIAKGKKQDPDKYKGLYIRYTEDDDYEVYSG